MVDPGSEAVLLRELGAIQRAIGGLEGAMVAHEKADEQRHDDTSKRLDKIEGNAENTGRQEVDRVRTRAERLEAEQVAATNLAAAKAEAASLTARTARRERFEKIGLAVMGAVLAIVVSFAAHALGLK